MHTLRDSAVIPMNPEKYNEEKPSPVTSHHGTWQQETTVTVAAFPRSALELP
jgi:hypothetical protein